jgi:hypothetical protein
MKTFLCSLSLFTLCGCASSASLLKDPKLTFDTSKTEMEVVRCISAGWSEFSSATTIVRPAKVGTEVVARDTGWGRDLAVALVQSRNANTNVTYARMNFFIGGKDYDDKVSACR